MKNYFRSSSMKESKLKNSAIPWTSSYLRLIPRLLVPSNFSFNNVYYKTVTTRDSISNVNPSFVSLYVQIRNVKCLSSRTLSLTLHTKSSFTKDGRPHRASSCTFSRPSLNIRTHFLTMPSLITLSPYTWQIWWWIWLGSTFLAFKKRITDLFHSRRPLQLS